MELAGAFELDAEGSDDDTTGFLGVVVVSSYEKYIQCQLEMLKQYNRLTCHGPVHFSPVMNGCFNAC